MAQQVAPPSTPYGAPIDMSAAKKVMAAAEAEAIKNNWGVAIAIVDSGACSGSITRSSRRSASPKPKQELPPSFDGRPRCSRTRSAAAALDFAS